jgi:hypothetical protein
MILRTLKDCTVLQNIPLSDDWNEPSVPLPDSTEEWKELEKEAAQCVPVMLNGVRLDDGRKMINLLRMLCNKLSQGLTKAPDNCNNQVTMLELYHGLLVRLSATQSAHTAQSAVEDALFGSNSGDFKELALAVPKKVRMLPLASLTLYVTGNAAHAVIDQSHGYGLFRKSDSAGKPWIALTATTHERVNFTSRQAVKSVQVQIQEEKYPVY